MVIHCFCFSSQQMFYFPSFIHSFHDSRILTSICQTSAIHTFVYFSTMVRLVAQKKETKTFSFKLTLEIYLFYFIWVSLQLFLSFHSTIYFKQWIYRWFQPNNVHNTHWTTKRVQSNPDKVNKFQPSQNKSQFYIELLMTKIPKNVVFVW